MRDLTLRFGRAAASGRWSTGRRCWPDLLCLPEASWREQGCRCEATIASWRPLEVVHGARCPLLGLLDAEAEGGRAVHDGNGPVPAGARSRILARFR
jgi:hypothetical protein